MNTEQILKNPVIREKLSNTEQVTALIYSWYLYVEKGAPWIVIGQTNNYSRLILKQDAVDMLDSILLQP